MKGYVEYVGAGIWGVFRNMEILYLWGRYNRDRYIFYFYVSFGEMALDFFYFLRSRSLGLGGTNE